MITPGGVASTATARGMQHRSQRGPALAGPFLFPQQFWRSTIDPMLDPRDMTFDQDKDNPYFTTRPHYGLSDFEWLEGLLTGVSYKPGFTIIAIPPLTYSDSPYIRFSASVRDSKNPNKVINVGREVEVPPGFLGRVHSDQFYRWLFDNILAFEKHEAQEWFKINGVMFEDPHMNDS